MNITQVTTKAGGRPRRRRVGRGHGSGLGKTSGRGHKGQGARAGGPKRGGLGEGGVFPLFRRIPKVGFSNKQFRTAYQVVNVGDLESRFQSGEHVSGAVLEEAGLIRDRKKPVKILGDGELKKKLIIEAERFSSQAATKIESCGGTIKRLGPQPKKKFVKRPPPPPPPKESAAKESAAKGKGGEAQQQKKQKAKGKPAPDAESGAAPAGQDGGES